MKKVKVIALVGMPGAGKSVCADHLKTKGWPVVYFGGITLEEMAKRNLEATQENEKFVREDIRVNEGKDAYAKRMIKKIEELSSKGNQVVVADGLYSWSEYKVFKEEYGDNAIIIAIAAARKLRHIRLEKRPVRPLSKDEANKRDYAEIENIEKGGPIANADYTLVNDKDQQGLIQDLEKIINEVI